MFNDGPCFGGGLCCNRPESDRIINPCKPEAIIRRLLRRMIEAEKELTLISGYLVSTVDYKKFVMAQQLEMCDLTDEEYHADAGTGSD